MTLCNNFLVWCNCRAFSACGQWSDENDRPGIHVIYANLFSLKSMYFLLCPLQTQNDRSVCEIYVSNLLKRWPNPKSISTLFSDCIGVLVGSGEWGRAVHHTTCWETISGTTSFEDWTMFYPMPTPSVSYRPVGCSYRVMCMNNYAHFLSGLRYPLPLFGAFFMGFSMIIHVSMYSVFLKEPTPFQLSLFPSAGHLLQCSWVPTGWEAAPLVAGVPDHCGFHWRHTPFH